MVVWAISVYCLMSAYTQGVRFRVPRATNVPIKHGRWHLHPFLEDLGYHGQGICIYLHSDSFICLQGLGIGRNGFVSSHILNGLGCHRRGDRTCICLLLRSRLPSFMKFLAPNSLVSLQVLRVYKQRPLNPIYEYVSRSRLL